MHNTFTGASAPTSFGGSVDSITQVHYKKNAGYFERVGQSLCGIVFGFLLVLAAFPVIYYNEGRAVQTSKSLDEGLRSVEPLSSTEHVFDSNNNKLVHLTGRLQTQLALTDPDFGIKMHSVKLKRQVEMYQWVETEHKKEYNEGEHTRVETTYTYSKEWRSDKVSSSGFNLATTHQNPNHMPISGYTKTASPVHVGTFRLSDGLVGSVSNFKDLPLRETIKPDWKLLENWLYRSNDAFRPQIGDIRVKFSYAGVSHVDNDLRQPQDEVSIVARQSASTLTGYRTKAGDTLELLYAGFLSAEQIFEQEHSNNNMLTWALRGVGWLLMFIGFQMIMDIFRQIVSFLPIIRDIVGLATSLVALTMSTSLALVVIAISWIRWRPALGMALLVAAVVPMFFSKRKADDEKKKEGHE